MGVSFWPLFSALLGVAGGGHGTHMWADRGGIWSGYGWEVVLIHPQGNEVSSCGQCGGTDMKELCNLIPSFLLHAEKWEGLVRKRTCVMSHLEVTHI